MKNTFLAISAAMAASGLCCILAAFNAPTDKNTGMLVLGGLLLPHAAVLPLAAAERCQPES